MDEQARAAFAQVMGMKPREIIAVEEAPGGWVVTTHDHQRTFVDETGRVAGAAAPAPAPSPVERPQVPDGRQSSGQTSGEQRAQDAGGSPADGSPADLEVPDGSEKEVLGWVDGDQDRAAAALRAEEARETPRKGLLGKLQQLVG